MISISKEVQTLMETLVAIDYMDLMQWRPSSDMIVKIQDVVSLFNIMCIYFLFFFCI